MATKKDHGVNAARATTPSRRASLRDVAEVAGVSAAAVSYVVTGRTSEVGPETLERIEAAIKALKYQPQGRGRSLKFNREFAIGLVIVDTDPSFLADPFTTQFASGLSNALVEPGYGLTVTGCRTIDDLEKLLSRPIAVDAYVVVCSGSRETRERAYRLLSDVNLPTVIVQDGVPEGLNDACAILQDDFGGGQALARHLHQCGASKITFITPAREWPAIERREAGITSVLKDGHSLERIECNEEDFVGTVEIIDTILGRAQLPDALMGANDQIAIAALRALNSRGIAVPHDVQVTGYNDFSFRNYVTPLLTTVTSSASEIGNRCAEAILYRLDIGKFRETRIELPVSLNIGGTTLWNGRLSSAPTGI
jgi:LacI family transcriptional regulator